MPLLIPNAFRVIIVPVLFCAVMLIGVIVVSYASSKRKWVNRLPLLGGMAIGLLFVSNVALGSNLELIWSIKDTFEMPESAAIDQKRQVIYVSNVNTYAKDANGFISRVGIDGKNLNLKWLEGLHSPTGIAIFQDTLYVADYDALVAIDLVNEKILQRFEAPDADSTPVLNDVAISQDGTVYVSGSRSRNIYQLANNQLEVWLNDKTLLEGANGLFVDSEILVHGGLRWSAFLLSDKSPVQQTARPANSMKDFDGIASDGDGGYLVTLIDDGRIWHLRKDGTVAPLSEDNFEGIDLQFIPHTRLLALPRVGGGLSLFKWNRVDQPK
jgi:hypothetical protein